MEVIGNSHKSRFGGIKEVKAWWGEIQERKETVEDNAYKQLLQGILLYLDVSKIFDIAFLESYFRVYICKCLNFLTIYLGSGLKILKKSVVRTKRCRECLENRLMI